MKLYQICFKRLLDIIISGVSLIILAIPLSAVAISLYFANKGSGVFFTQERPGRGGKIFKVIKFKSMTDKRDSNGQLLPNAMRITPVGNLLRKTSIDELPQLLNVFKGDMSLIGPRPLLPRYLNLYSPEQARRHDVRPGITGWAQVNGRNAISWTEKFELDVWYVDNYSFTLDCKIILQTILNVFKGQDILISTGGFNGSN